MSYNRGIRTVNRQVIIFCPSRSLLLDILTCIDLLSLKSVEIAKLSIAYRKRRDTQHFIFNFTALRLASSVRKLSNITIKTNLDRRSYTRRRTPKNYHSKDRKLRSSTMAPALPVDTPMVVLFGYDASPFTLKVRLALRLKQVPYTFIPVPPMMPRPILKDTFNLTYRKIPVCAIGARDVYCDTALILEALEHHFPASAGYGTLYPLAKDGRQYRGLIRGFTSYWTDRPLFRVMTGLIPARVWRSTFGQDRAQLIGHQLDADKLEAKIPENLMNFDTQLSILERLFINDNGLENTRSWIFSAPYPSLADLALYYQLAWGHDIAAGRLVENLTAGAALDTQPEDGNGAIDVFNAERYPGVCAWYERLKHYLNALPAVEQTAATASDVDRVLACIKAPLPSIHGRPKVALLLPTPQASLNDLDAKCGLIEGALVSVTPDDTGRGDPTVGKLIGLSPEEVVIEPQPLNDQSARSAAVDVRIHFPRLGFVVRRVHRPKL